ncbi:MAG TPA: universal stress protein [Chitinophaga sp.]|uniref:universal stress protein n=1 Tax=Chitinophaga sp. TaxID=1869181 RepID=UPI002C3A003D|nr:universal stress protein [Chitinophaga sp.]HVI48767.1 universal stress protein [Chitinophaga sp.]
MKSMLILTDFSENAFRAAEYACQLAIPLQIGHVILYHAYQPFIVATDLPANIPPNDQETYAENMEALGLQHDRLRSVLPQHISIEMQAENSVLPERINQLCREKTVELMVMGASSKSGMEKFLTGSTSSLMVETSEAPLLIVPPDVPLGHTLSDIIFTTDLEDPAALSVHQLYKFLDVLPAKLHVVNIAPQTGEQYSPQTRDAIDAMHRIFEKYNAEFHYVDKVDTPDTTAGILDFAAQYRASLIIAVPKKHSFVYDLFHKSVSKTLAKKSDVPLLYLPSRQ